MTLTNDDRLESLSNELREIESQIAILTEARNDRLTRIAAIVGTAEGTIMANGKPVLSVTYTKRFNHDLARTVLPADLVELITDKVISASKAKELLPPTLYKACQKPAASPTIKAKVAAA